jgi:hypothetical protein
LQPDAAGKDGAVMKKQVAVVALALGLSLTGGTAMAPEGFKVLDTIAGTSLKLVQSALLEFTRNGLKLDGYRITVVTFNGNYGVMFKDLKVPPGEPGSTAENPEFAVELNKDGAVVRSYFMR